MALPAAERWRTRNAEALLTLGSFFVFVLVVCCLDCWVLHTTWEGSLFSRRGVGSSSLSSAAECLGFSSPFPLYFYSHHFPLCLAQRVSLLSWMLCCLVYNLTVWRECLVDREGWNVVNDMSNGWERSQETAVLCSIGWGTTNLCVMFLK